MPDSVTRFAIRVAGGFRTLFKVIEKPNGELIISISGGERLGHGGSGPRVIEQRYSVHTSQKSAEFNVLKQTIAVEEGEPITTVALTDSVKLKNGFCVIFVRRCQRLVEDLPETANPNETTLVLSEFDQSLFNFMHGIFVGSLETEFDARDPDIVINVISFKNFKLVIAASLYALPSHHTTEILSNVTLPPEAELEQQSERRFLMTGRSPEICLQQYRNAVRLLVKRFLEMILATEADLDGKTVAMIQDDLAKIGELGLTDVEVGAGRPKLHMLTSGPLRALESNPLFAEFLRTKGGPEPSGK